MNKKQYTEFFNITKKITKGDQRAQDLFHDTMIQLHSNNQYENLKQEEKKFFFIRAITNQYHSNSSQFKRKYSRFNFSELQETLEIEDGTYEEEPTLDWLKETLEQELKDNPDFWYDKGIFELWLKHKGFIERIHKQTSIPRYAIKETIAKTKKWLKIKWELYKNGN